MLFVDSGTGLERAVDRNNGAKTSALEIYQQMTTKSQKKDREGPEYDGLTRFGHNEEIKFKKVDFEKERDYRKELIKELGQDRYVASRVRGWDRGM
jgi:hypothetical protein